MRFHRTAMIVAAAGTLPFVVACSNNSSTPSDAGVDSSFDGAVIADAGVDSGLDSGDAGALTDAQIVGALQAINDGEIQAAQLAMTNTTNFAVHEFSSRMITDYTAASDELLALYNDGGLDGGFVSLDAGDGSLPGTDAGIDGGVVATSPLAQQITTTTEQRIATLTPLMGDAFDTTYATDELQAHQQVLNIIDTQLTPEATSPELKSYLAAYRALIVMHIQLAEALIAELGDSGAADAGIDAAGDGGLDAGATNP